MAGAGYRLFNTGDVLTAAQVNTFLQEQAVMRFANATARTTALSGVLSEGMMSYLDDTNSVEVYNGSAWVSVGGSTSPLTTKGDLYTYSTTNARLAVGSNGDTLIADSGATTGLRWSSQPSASNPVINSAFQVWQRGTSVSVAASTNAYTADRWAISTNANQAFTISRQTTSDTTNLPFIQYCARVQRNSGQTGTTVVNYTNSFETINSIPYAGKTVTLSLYARAGANYSAASNALAIGISTGTGTDQSLIGYTGAAYPLFSSATLTTTWQRFTVTGTLATSATELGVYLQFTPTGTAGANDWFEVTGVQIDIGSVALPFRTYSATLAGELSACQRYYVRFGPNSATPFQGFGYGFANSTSVVYANVPLPVQMRTTPTTIDSANAIRVQSNINVTISSIAYGNVGASPTTGGLYITTPASLTTGNMYLLCADNNNTAFIGFSAEL